MPIDSPKTTLGDEFIHSVTSSELSLKEWVGGKLFFGSLVHPAHLFKDTDPLPQGFEKLRATCSQLFRRNILTVFPAILPLDQQFGDSVLICIAHFSQLWWSF